MPRSPSWFGKICMIVSAIAAAALLSQLAVISYRSSNPATAAGYKLLSNQHLRAIAADLDPNLMASLPDSFLPQFKTPCWLSSPSAPVAQQVKRSAGPAAAAQLQSTDHPPDNAQRKLLQEKQQQQEQMLAEQQQAARLHCLPYFHILGSFQSGAFSLYNMLSQHPAVGKGHNPRPHFWAEHDKTFTSYMAELAGAVPFIQQHQSSAVLGDASESTFAFYTSAGMRGHRKWQLTVQPCFARCEKLQGDFRRRCMEVCWWNATSADDKNALRLGVQPRWRLDTPLLMKAAYSRPSASSTAATAAAAPKLIVLLREPGQRLLSAFLEYGHYKARYGDSAQGFLAFVKEQLSAFQACLDKYSSLEECTLLFETLDYTNEQVYFHCDQVLRGLYWVYLEVWQRSFGPDQLLVLFSEELFTSPKAALQRVMNFLGLSEIVTAAVGSSVTTHTTAAAGAAAASGRTLQDDIHSDIWSAMVSAGGHRPSLTAQQNYYDVLPESKQLVQHFYEPHNRRLGQLLTGKAISPWDDLPQALGSMYTVQQSWRLER